MDYIEWLLWTLHRTRGSLMRSLESVTDDEAAWRPCGSCNSIGSMVIHLGRVEDTWVHRIAGGKDIWETEGWAGRFGLPANDRGWTYDKQPPGEKRPLAELIQYYEATHRLLEATIRETPSSRYQEPIQSPMNLTVEQIFAHVVNEENQHVGQIDYLKGMRRGQ